MNSRMKIVSNKIAQLTMIVWAQLVLLPDGTTAATGATTPAVLALPKTKIVLAGDSTVTDDAGWGGIFAKCFRPDRTEVINLSRGGRSSKSFYDEGRWKQTLDLKPDYVFIQFGHNDEPGHGPERETNPQTTYRANMERYVDEARAAGIQPVLVTPLSRRQWKDGRINSSLAPYAQVVREIATARAVPMIDLHDRSIAVYMSLGQEGTELISPPKPGGLDGTHLNAPGARLLGEIVADEARRAVTTLASNFQGYREEAQRAEAPQPKPHPLLAEPVTEPTRQGSKTFVVAGDGSGNYRTIQEAIAAAPSNNADRTTIRIKSGTYQGQIVVPKSKPNLSFVGDSAETTVLTYALNVKDPVPASVPQRYNGNGVVLLGDGFHAENITFENTSGDHGQAMAVRVEGDRSVFRDCRLLGWQDTLLVSSGRQYFKDCYIEGRVDFIYGGSTAFFENCQIHSKNGGYITAASTPEAQKYGYVFRNCRVTGDGIAAYLGRPWRPFAAVAFINCEMNNHIRPEGWHNWGKPENEKTARYMEYGSKTPDGNPADVSQRVPWSKQLSKKETDKITVEAVLGGNDNWNPTQTAATSATTITGSSVAAGAGTQPAASRLPTLWIIGDSTVRSGDGTGSDGHWGWGDPIAAYFDATKIKVVNRARGGRSSRTFITEGLWDAVLKELQPDDFVLMQFGHNDSVPVEDVERPRGSIRSTGEETREIENPKTRQKEIVRTYGSYMRQMINDAKARGATPIVLSPVPRKRWTAEDKIVRNLDNYTTLSRAVAQSQGVAFVDLNAIIADRYDAMGKVKVDELFPKDGTHHNLAGADINAASVIAGLKALKDQPLNRYLSAKGETVAPYTITNAGK